MALVQAVAERADSELPSPRIKPCVLKALLPLGLTTPGGDSGANRRRLR